MTRRAEASGFILVGVVMFVLALTILGLSLFTLSSYEAQSLTQSHSRQQSDYDAQSGIEMVKSLIMTSPNRLDGAAAAVGSFGVVNAVAKQHRSNGTWDSTGVVVSDSTVIVRVTSSHAGELRTLEARFRPSTTKDFYKRLFTVANSVEVENTEVLPGPVIIIHPASQLRLTGQVWQTVTAPADTAWADSGQVTWGQPHFEYTDPVAVIDLPNYIATHPTAFLPEFETGDPDEHKLIFDKHPHGTVGYYSSPGNLVPGSFYTFEEDARADVEVEGTVVWIVPAGLQFKQQVHFKANSDPSVLIIVAGQNGGNPSSPAGAIHFQGGFTVDGSDKLHVILVTDAKVLIEFANEANTYECRVDRLSVLCRDLLLQGPKNVAPIRELRLRYDPATSPIIDALYSEASNPLPRPPGSTNALTFIRGSWRRATP